jgi:hypothetical protein
MIHIFGPAVLFLLLLLQPSKERKELARSAGWPELTFDTALELIMQL